MEVTIRKVGGCVRDQLLGVPTKDIDFSVEIPDLVGRPGEVGFFALRDWLNAEGFEIFVETPETMTIRAQFPRGHEMRGVTTADFVLCRVEGPYGDGRRPDWTTVGTLTDDLNRRDFTVNAMAEGTDGSIIDLHGGREDLDARLLRCVGSAMERFREDPVRVMRAMRFIVVKGFRPDQELLNAFHEPETAKRIADEPHERREHELRLMFQHDTLDTLTFLHDQFFVPTTLRDAMLGGLKLNPTTKRQLPRRG